MLRFGEAKLFLTRLFAFSDSFDWEFGENPDVSSNYYAYVNDDSYDGPFGKDSDGNNFVIDQRGFKYIFLQEANQFLKPNDPRVHLNTTITNIKYSDSGVVITAKDGGKIQADYAISTFRYIEFFFKSLSVWKLI